MGGLASWIGRLRVDTLDSEIKRARNDIQWAIGLMFVVPVGLLIILRVWS
ncbi:hypothetical protein MKK58_21935 [Methylobacterium sp. J-078]|nr:hypothetical protein [Methylobacterium sp. J-078]MCJ2047174.1 hypothetical protein [Methylobacterium sp. J-078]